MVPRPPIWLAVFAVLMYGFFFNGPDGGLPKNLASPCEWVRPDLNTWIGFRDSGWGGDENNPGSCPSMPGSPRGTRPLALLR